MKTRGERGALNEYTVTVGTIAVRYRGYGSVTVSTAEDNRYSMGTVAHRRSPEVAIVDEEVESGRKKPTKMSLETQNEKRARKETTPDWSEGGGELNKEDKRQI